jgi:hypothetical protein
MDAGLQDIPFCMFGGVEVDGIQIVLVAITTRKWAVAIHSTPLAASHVAPRNTAVDIGVEFVIVVVMVIVRAGHSIVDHANAIVIAATVVVVADNITSFVSLSVETFEEFFPNEGLSVNTLPVAAHCEKLVVAIGRERIIAVILVC